MYDAKFNNQKSATDFYNGQLELGISASYPRWDGDCWVVRTIET
jgi:hypothetical protein